MGMYTEFHFNAALKKDTPKNVVAILQFMADADYPKPSELPDHPFFACDRWVCLFTMGSYSFMMESGSVFRYDDIGEYYILSVRSNLKNYDDEISKFADWITPYLDSLEGDFLGFQRYEETEWPTLLHYPNHWTPTDPPIMVTRFEAVPMEGCNLLDEIPKPPGHRRSG